MLTNLKKQYKIAIQSAKFEKNIQLAIITMILIGGGLSIFKIQLNIYVYFLVYILIINIYVSKNTYHHFVDFRIKKIKLRVNDVYRENRISFLIYRKGWVNSFFVGPNKFFNRPCLAEEF